MASSQPGAWKVAFHLPLLLLCLVLTSVQGQTNCQTQEKCDACIQTQGCMWCPNPKKDEDGNVMKHCQPITIDSTSFCNTEELENPKNSHTIIDDEPLTSVSEELTNDDEKIIQLAPQKIKLKLRKATPETVTVKFRQARGYPVDLYYLMDLSNSMQDDKKSLAKLGGKLTETLGNLTKKFTIGFGSFVDKVMMPFADMSPDKINIPCKGCSKAYAFKNNMALDTNGTIFTQRVEEAAISGNLDTPEGGLDALMQAMVCTEEIGWREQSRRIIVYSTDDKFHYAGDGRLAGIVAPNDEKCHLNEDNEYGDFDKYDYPSIAQINKISKMKNINIIFAVSAHEKLYQDVSNLIETSSYGLMNEDSSNVVTLVEDQYNQISSKVQLMDNSTDSPVSITYTSDCKNSTDDPRECSGISQGSEVTFNLTLTANKCPKDPLILEVKTMQDRLFLEIEFECSCGCANVAKKDNSSMCTYHGHLVCGVCDCFPGYQGQQCMCSLDDASDGSPEDEQMCKAPDEDRVCSGQGYCKCGACACREEEITGKYCECNRRKCLTGQEGNVCSGHGSCDCNSCNCQDGYHGPYCECPPDSACIMPGGTPEVCSGHGTCECGLCKCNQTYSGQFCDDCLGCKTGRCMEFKDSIQCLFRDPPCPHNLTTNVVESLSDHIKSGAQECTFYDDSDSCFFKFSYLYSDSDRNYDIHVLKNKECPEEAPIMSIILGLVGGIVAAGLLALIAWKIATVVHDRKEYQRFEKERLQGTWSNDNQLYRDPLQTVQNPVFSAGSS